MQKRGIVTILVTMIACLCLAGAAFAGEGPETIVLKAKKGNITFQHHKHQGRTECGECHHEKGPDGKQVAFHKGMKIQNCDVCHNKSFANKKLNKPMKAFHKNCKGCHKQHKAPTKCKFCHKK